MKKLLLSILIIAGCATPYREPLLDLEETPVKEITALEDQALTGKFVWSHYWVDSDGIEEINEYLSITMDGTNKLTYYHDVRNYTVSGGWDIDTYNFTLEMETSGGQQRIRQWWEQDGGWSDWSTYTLTGGELTITLYGDTYTMTKQ